VTNIHSNYHIFSSTQFRRLSDEQCQRLYWACLEILERTGVRLYDQEALDLLKKSGVPATDGNRVRIPAGSGPTGYL
jgi:trimethylamine--corrinoid protein Co-methyltransferase